MKHQDPNIEGEPIFGSPDEAELRRSHTSWKLAIENAIRADTRLSMSARVIAAELLYYAHHETRAIYPSQKLLAATLGISDRAVKACIKQLIEMDWLMVSRASMNTSNSYALDDGNIAFFVRRRQRVRDEVAAMRGRRLPLSKTDHGKLTSPREGKDTSPATGSSLPLNTLSKHHDVTPRDPIGIDKEDLLAGVYVPPSFDHMEGEEVSK